MNLSLNLIAILAAYLTGSISTAILTCRLLHLPDPRTTGSNNPGATNVLRSGGRKAGAITLVGDMLKGLLPVLLIQQLGLPTPVLAAAGLAAFLGHLFPVYYGFTGGKGVATFYGVLLGLHWPSGLAALAVWGVTAAISRYSSLSALVSILIAPLLLYINTRSAETAGVTALMCLLVYWRHRANIRRLLNGTEARIGRKST